MSVTLVTLSFPESLKFAYMAWLTKYFVLLLVMTGLVFSSGYANIKKCNKSIIGVKLVGSDSAPDDGKDKNVPISGKTCQTTDWASKLEINILRHLQFSPQTVRQFLLRDFKLPSQATVNDLYKPPRHG